MVKNNVFHFILTRFNLLLWNKDKEGHPVRTTQWLEHRFELFEKYCLPSIANQTCKNFKWIILFDSTTPDHYKERITGFEFCCPQLIAVYVSPESGRYFAQIFRDEVVNRLKGERVITTYLDNDDAFDIHLVEDIQKRAESLPDGTFISYDYGYQFFTDYNYVMRIHFPRNHFISVVEKGNPSTMKTIYGFGSHYYINRIPKAKIEHVKNLPMWCEVIHDKNMGNDAYFLRAKMMNERELLLQDFGIQETVQSSASLYLFRFLPRYVKTYIRRIGYRLFGRHW